MAKISRLAGSTSHVLTVFIQDSTSTTGAGLTGLAFGSAGLTCYYKRNRGTASVAVTLATIATFGTYASGGLREIDSAGLPGFYEFHPPDAAMASGAGSVAFLLKGASNMVPCPLEIELTAINNQDAQQGGLAALPAAGTLAVNPTLAAGQFSFKKNAALAGFTFPMFDPADHVTPKSGLTVAGTVSIDGASAVSLTNAVSAVGGGLYKVNLAAGDTNGNVLCFAFSATGADPRVFTVVTQP